MACALFAVAALTMGLAAPSFPRDLALIALPAALAASTALILVWRQASRLAKALAARDAMLQVAFL